MREEPARNEWESLGQLGVASEDRVRQTRVAVLTRRDDKKERGRGTAGNGGGKSGSETSEGSSTNQKSGVWRPRGIM